MFLLGRNADICFESSSLFTSALVKVASLCVVNVHICISFVEPRERDRWMEGAERCRDRIFCTKFSNKNRNLGQWQIPNVLLFHSFVFPCIFCPSYLLLNSFLEEQKGWRPRWGSQFSSLGLLPFSFYIWCLFSSVLAKRFTSWNLQWNQAAALQPTQPLLQNIQLSQDTMTCPAISFPFKMFYFATSTWRASLRDFKVCAWSIWNHRFTKRCHLLFCLKKNSALFFFLLTINQRENQSPDPKTESAVFG